MSEAELPTLKERLASAGFAAVERMALALPETWGSRLFDLGGTAAYHAAPKARGVVSRNLGQVLGRDPGSPTVQAAVKEAFRSYARYWYDTFHVRTLSREDLLARMTFDGAEHFHAAAEAGRGAIVALPHLGNWDVAGRWVVEQGFDVTAVAELLRPEAIFQLFLHHREALGMGVVPLDDDGKVGEELVRLLGENHVIALVADRDLKGRGVTVEMFGRERQMPPGPAMLSLATGAPLLPCAPYDTDDGWAARLDPPLEIERTGNMREDVTNLTRALAAVFERAIAAIPTQWHMFQPAWEEPVPAAAAGSAAAGSP